MVNPISLETFDQTPSINDTCKIAGWGNIINMVKILWYPLVLQSAEVKIVPMTDCKRHYQEEMKETLAYIDSTNLILCAIGENGKDSGHASLHTFRKVNFLSKNSILTKPQHFHEFFIQFFLTIFLVKSKLSTAKKSKTTTFSLVFHPKK